MAASPFIDPRAIYARARPLIVEAIRSVQAVLLLRYSEWLDSEQHLIKADSEGDSRTHEELVNEFLRETSDTDEAR